MRSRTWWPTSSRFRACGQNSPLFLGSGESGWGKGQALAGQGCVPSLQPLSPEAGKRGERCCLPVHGGSCRKWVSFRGSGVAKSNPGPVVPAEATVVSLSAFSAGSVWSMPVGRCCPDADRRGRSAARCENRKWQMAGWCCLTPFKSLRQPPNWLGLRATFSAPADGERWPAGVVFLSGKTPLDSTPGSLLA